MERLSEHFTLSELIKSSTATRRGINNIPSVEKIEKLKFLCEEILEPIRKWACRPIRPNSGYRSHELNEAIGGSTKSQHCKAEAVDVEVVGVSNYDLARWVEEHLIFDQLILECYQVGVPTSGWVHISRVVDDNKNRGDVLTYTNFRYIRGLVQ